MTQITIPNEAITVTYAVVAPSTGPFVVPFTFLRQEDVRAIVTDTNGDETTLLIVTDFTFTDLDFPVGQEGIGYTGGEITLLSSIGADGDTEIRIFRSTVIDRSANFPRTGPIDMAIMNDELNDHIAIMQELSAGITAILVLPNGVVEGQLLRWNEAFDIWTADAPISILGVDDVVFETLSGKLYLKTPETGNIQRQVGYNAMAPQLEDGAYTFDDIGNGGMILNEDADAETWTVDIDSAVDDGALYGLSNEGAGDVTLLVGAGVTMVHIASDGTRTTKLATFSWTLQTGFLGSLWKRSTTEFWWWGTTNITA